MSAPCVSVVMPTWNGIRYSEQAIRSILTQTYTDFELIIVDDGSTDHSIQLVEHIIRESNDQRLRLLRHPSNRGCSASTTTGIEAARGRYVAFMDHDDIACPHRLREAVTFLDANPTVDGCGARHAMFSNSLSIRAVRTWRAGKKHVISPEVVAASTLFGGMLFNPTVCCKTNILRQGINLDSQLVVGADDDWYERLQANGARFAILPSIAILYRRHGQNASLTHADKAAEARVGTSVRAARRLIPNATEDETALHARMVLRDPDIASDHLPSIRAWLERLRLAGEPLYGEKAIRTVLRANWLRACALTARHGFMAGLADAASWEGGGGSLSLSEWGTFLYQYQKRTLRHLRKKKPRI